MTFNPITDSRLGNPDLITSGWLAACGIDVTGYDPLLEFVLATWGLSDAAHGNDAMQVSLQWRRAGGSFADVTAITEICWGIGTQLIDGTSPCTITSACQTQNNGMENEGDNCQSGESVSYGTYGEIQWALGFGPGVLDNQEYEFQLTQEDAADCSGSPVAIATCSCSIKTAAIGWGHKIQGLANANIAKINGVAIANIAKVNGV